MLLNVIFAGSKQNSLSLKRMLHNFPEDDSKMKGRGQWYQKDLLINCSGVSDLQNKQVGWQFGWWHCPLLAGFSITLTLVLAPVEFRARCMTKPCYCSISCCCDETVVVSQQHHQYQHISLPSSLPSKDFKALYQHSLIVSLTSSWERKINGHSSALAN